MTPAPETGRTAEDLKADIIAALNAAFRGFSFPGGRWSAGYGSEMAAEALLAGPLAPVLAEIAQLRSRLLQAEQGGEVMRETLKTIAQGEVMTFDEGLGFEVSFWMDEEEMSALARAALATPILNPNQEAGDHEPR